MLSIYIKLGGNCLAWPGSLVIALLIDSEDQWDRGFLATCLNYDGPDPGYCCLGVKIHQLPSNNINLSGANFF